MSIDSDFVCDNDGQGFYMEYCDEIYLLIYMVNKDNGRVFMKFRKLKFIPDGEADYIARKLTNDAFMSKLIIGKPKYIPYMGCRSGDKKAHISEKPLHRLQVDLMDVSGEYYIDYYRILDNHDIEVSINTNAGVPF